VLASFANYSELHLGPWEGNLSLDGAAVAFLGQSPGGTQVAFVYDIGTETKHADVDLDGVSVDWVSVSPLGTYLVANGWSDETQVHDRDGTPVGARWSEYGVPSHYDLTVDPAGDEVAVGVAQSGPHTGKVIARRLSDGAITPLTAGGFASHTSTRNGAAPGGPSRPTISDPATYSLGDPSRFAPVGDRPSSGSAESSTWVEESSTWVEEVPGSGKSPRNPAKGRRRSYGTSVAWAIQTTNPRSNSCNLSSRLFQSFPSPPS